MIRITGTTLVMFCVMIWIPTGVVAQTPAEVIEAALAQSLYPIEGSATIIEWNPDHSYEVLREGDNGFVCYDRSNERDRAPFAAQCTNEGNLERVAQNRRFRAETDDVAGEGARIREAEEAGTRVRPEYGSIWFRMDGEDAESALLHATIAVPGATTESLGLPDNPNAGGVWLMSGGTSAAHLMVPGR